MGASTRAAHHAFSESLNAAGQAVLKLKTLWRDGTTHQGTPLEFMQLPIEWPVCGGQVHWLYVCSGSLNDLCHQIAGVDLQSVKGDRPLR